jgi:hypothetical protein
MWKRYLGRIFEEARIARVRLLMGSSVATKVAGSDRLNILIGQVAFKSFIGDA